jgi:hypothetical protein
MGWMFTRKERGEPIIDFFRREFEYRKEDGSYAKVLACRALLDVAYLAVQVKRGDGESETFGVVCLIRHQAKNRDGFNFGYKDVEETCGPCETGCPAEILDLLSPTEHPFALEWRAKCRERLARKKARPHLTKGCRLVFETPVRFSDGAEIAEFTVKDAKRLLLAHGGWDYRIARRCLEQPYSVEKAPRGS